MSNIIVLGATSGIAKALCYKMAGKGHNLILAGRDLDELHQITNDISIRYQVRVIPQFFDALSYDTHNEFFEKCVNSLGTIDGLVLAYGYMGEQRHSEVNFSVARCTIETNFLSCVSILNIAAEYFAERKAGTICAISSVAGDRGRQSNYIYGSAKAGLSAYLQGLRNRLAPVGVHVLTVKPGFVDTKMTYGMLKESPLVAKPEQVANDIYQAMMNKKDILYTPFFWCWIMFIIKSIPERWFKKMKL